MDEMILKHMRTLPVELVAAELAKSLTGPRSSSGYTYEDKERGYFVRVEVVGSEKATCQHFWVKRPVMHGEATVCGKCGVVTGA